MKRFYGCFCVPPFRKDNYFTEVLLMSDRVPG